MNLRLVVRLAASLLAVALFVVPAQASAAKDKPLVVCKHGCKYKTVQKAVDKVKKGGTVNVLPGKYVEGVILDGHGFDDVTIQGVVEKQAKSGGVSYKKADATKVILEGKNAKIPDGSTANNGIEGIDVDGLVVKNMTARNYGANGFFVHDSDPDAANNTIECNDYLFKNTISAYNRAYGVYAFGCAGGRITKSTGYGHGDSAFYIGGTPIQAKPKQTRLDHLEAYENVLGYSGTNSRYITIEDSDWYNNGIGLVPNTLDSEPFEPTEDGVIQNNDIFWNNFNYFLPNSGVKTVSDGLGTVEGVGTLQYPTGVGVALFGSGGWVVKNNNIFGNFKWGAATFSDPFNDGDDAISRNNQYIDNQMGRGGTDTNAVDFWIDGSGSGNCFSGNTSSTFDPSGTAGVTIESLYPSCPAPAGPTPGANGTSFGDSDQVGELLGYSTADPPETQECSWTQHSHPKFEKFKAVDVKPDPNCS